MASNEKSKKGGWVVTVPMAACAIAFLVFVFLPGAKQFGAKRAELDNKRAYITLSSDQLVQLQQAEKDLTATRAYNDIWRQRVPDERNLAALFGQLNSGCQAAGVGILRFEPKEATTYSSVSQVPVLLETKGSYAQLMEMLVGLESLPAPLWVESLHLDFSDKSGGDATCQTTLAAFADLINDSN